MSEWRDFLESVELTDRQERIINCVLTVTRCKDSEKCQACKNDLEGLYLTLIEEFTGVRII